MKLFLEKYTAIHTTNKNKGFLNNFFLFLSYKYVLISFFFTLFFFQMHAQTSFLDYQMGFYRVQKAYSSHYQNIKKEFEVKNFAFPPRDILLMSFKAEGVLEVWVKQGYTYELFKVYNVCKKSGDFGPKRAQGDQQVPEGLYSINVFNPNSEYHLSLGVSYPNTADKLHSSASDLGGDIYIHGSCVTIGCLPMTDEVMEEIYVLSLLAKNEGQQIIPIHLYPFKFNKLTEYIFYKEYPQHVSFWENLKSEYYFFKENQRIRSYNFDNFGNYTFFDF